MKTRLILTAITVVASGVLYAADVPPVGSAAPDFSSPDANGKTQSLAQYKGKYVVLEWFNPECPFEKKHYGTDNMQKLQAEYTGKGVVWFTIDSNAPGTEGNITAEQAKKIMESWKTNQTALVLDPESKIAKLYGAKYTPHMVIINRDGKIVYERAIDSKTSPKPADTPTSTNYVRAARDDSLGGTACSNAQTKPHA